MNDVFNIMCPLERVVDLESLWWMGCYFYINDSGTVPRKNINNTTETYLEGQQTSAMESEKATFLHCFF